MTLMSNFRRKMTSLSLAAVIASGTMALIPQASFASDWMEMLKPLVQNVIVPGASMGMKKLIQREERLHPGLASKVNNANGAYDPNSSGSAYDPSGTAQFFDGSTPAAGSTTTSSSDPFTTPQEPLATSSAEGAIAGSEYWAASHSASATEPAPPPPPPVATP
jgi:hypothetical protein